MPASGVWPLTLSNRFLICWYLKPSEALQQLEDSELMSRTPGLACFAGCWTGHWLTANDVWHPYLLALHPPVNKGFWHKNHNHLMTSVFGDAETATSIWTEVGVKPHLDLYNERNNNKPFKMLLQCCLWWQVASPGPSKIALYQQTWSPQYSPPSQGAR